MRKHTEIMRTIHVDDKVVEVHIHLTEDEIRRLILPHVVDVFASELRRRTPEVRFTLGSSTDSSWLTKVR